MKFVLTLLSILFVAGAHAQTTFECLDRNMKPFANWKLSSQKQVHGEWIKITTGGVGDEPVTTMSYRETTRIEAIIVFDAGSVSINLFRYIWDGYPKMMDWEGFAGSVRDELIQKEFHIESVAASQQEWAVPFIYQYQITEKSIVGTTPIRSKYYCRLN